MRMIGVFATDKTDKSSESDARLKKKGNIMSKELEALNYLVNLAVVGNKEYDLTAIIVKKVFTSEEIILQALKRNKPMKVVNIKTEEDIFSGKHDVAVCPNCGYEFYINRYINFCEKCGQRLDWSDEK